MKHEHRMRIRAHHHWAGIRAVGVAPLAILCAGVTMFADKARTIGGAGLVMLVMSALALASRLRACAKTGRADERRGRG